LKVVLGSDHECPHCHPLRDEWHLQAASKILQPGYKNNYNPDMLRYIPFKSISGREHIRWKPTPPCKLWKFQYGPHDIDPREDL
jgi:hypothetical protein